MNTEVSMNMNTEVSMNKNTEVSMNTELDEMQRRLWAAVTAAQCRGDATHRPENRAVYAMILYMMGTNQGMRMFTPDTPAARAYYEAQCEDYIARLDALTPTPDAHPCGWAVEDEHNPHYAGACACYGY